MVTDRGKRRALVKATGGRYQVTGLTPGGYTLIASSATHSPVAEFLLVNNGSTTHDIEL
ncbi:hypothetical protein [Phaeacidiphilus oryzae]|uniref:hypothetical protein n=1 Tax=Phaeacidiphilus oryzae TaxID=348818 RepID=UPI000AE51CE1|nr:hypothetical protein [Phaeacidiphilus oryzae]